MRAPPRHLAPHKVPRDMHVSHTVSRTSQCMSRTRYGVSTLAFSVHDTRYGTEVWYTGMVQRYGTQVWYTGMVHLAPDTEPRPVK